MPGAGPLRDKVTFQRQASGAGDGAGNYGQAFADIAGAKRISASINPLSQSEAVIAAGIEGRRIYEVRVRYTPTLAEISVNDIMIDARDTSRRFNVKAPPLNKDMRKRWLTLLVELGGAVG